MRGALLVVALLLLAGCVSPGARLAPSSAAVAGARSALVAYTQSGLVPVPDDAQKLAARIFDVGGQGSEPTLGVTKDGSIFVTGGGPEVWKSSDHGASWKNVADSRPRPDLDAYIWVDPLTDRIFSTPDNVVCSNLMWSDNGGTSWTWNPAAGCGIPGHDHQSLVTGPPPTGVKTNGYPDVVYYSYNSFREGVAGLPPGQDGTWLDASFDGGMTFGLGTQVLPADACEDGVNGAPAVAADGTVYVPMPRCDGMHIGVSHDAGKTWKVASVTDVGTLGAKDPKGPGLAGDTNPLSPNPGAGVDAAGNAFIAFAGADGKMYLTRSTDEGATWSKPIVVSPPEVTSTAFSALVAGDAGRVAIAYLATNDSTADWKGRAAQWASDDTVWHLELTTITSALEQDPTITSLRVTPDDDPVQIGCIWESGGSNACRNLGDFFDITELNGRAYIVYTDGCDKCKSASDSHGDALKVAVESTGPSLLATAPNLAGYV